MTWDGPTLFDASEYPGGWWSPEHLEERVAGTASFDPEEGVRLRTIGAFEWAPTEPSQGPLSPALLLGLVGSVPTPVTLYRASRIGPVATSPQPTASTFTARYMIVGHHFHAPDDVVFSSLSASFTDLEEWVGHHPFAGMIPGTNTRYVAPEPVSAEVGSLGARVTVGSSVSNKSDGLRSMRWDHVALLTVQPEAPQALGWYEETLRGLQDLLTLLVGRPVYPRAVKAKVSAGHGAEAALFSHQGSRSPRDRSLTSAHSLSRQADPLITMRQISPGLPIVLDKWFRKRDLLRPVYELFFGSLFAPRLYPEFQFLSLAQALETYHARTRPGASRCSFKRRLEDLLGALPVPGIVREDPNLVEKVRDTRNYLTHYPERLEGRALRGTELMEVIDELRKVLAFFLLGELGLDTETVLEALAKIPQVSYFSVDE